MEPNTAEVDKHSPSRVCKGYSDWGTALGLQLKLRKPRWPCLLVLSACLLVVICVSRAIIKDMNPAGHSQVHYRVRARIAQPEPEVLALTPSLKDLWQGQTLIKASRSPIYAPCGPSRPPRKLDHCIPPCQRYWRHLELAPFRFSCRPSADEGSGRASRLKGD